METSFEIAEADIDAAEEKALEDQTPAELEAEELASLVEDAYLIGQTCNDYYADDLAFEKKTETFKQYLAENRETVLKLKAKFPTGFHNTRILIRGKMMTWEEFVNDCFGVSRQYIDKLLKEPATVILPGSNKSPRPTEKELLKAQVVELTSKVEELNAELATVRTPEAQLPLPVKAEPAPAKITSGVPDYEYEEEPTFDDVIHYFESLGEDDRIQQITELCRTGHRIP